jgi:hypothetical protein
LTTKFCTACANPLIATAVICPKCGSPVNGIIPSAVGGKSKTTAVLLAVFLGTWSWLYTYRENASKFWITAIVLFGIPFLVVVLTAVTYSSGGYRGVQGWMAAVTGLFWYLSLFGFWLWSIIDNAVKSDNWYRNYWTN